MIPPPVAGGAHRRITQTAHLFSEKLGTAAAGARDDFRRPWPRLWRGPRQGVG